MIIHLEGWPTYLGGPGSLEIQSPIETPLCPTKNLTLCPAATPEGWQNFPGSPKSKWIWLLGSNPSYSKLFNSHVIPLTEITMGRRGTQLKMEAHKEALRKREEETSSNRSRSPGKRSPSKTKRSRSISRLAREKHLLMESKPSPTSRHSPTVGPHSPLTPGLTLSKTEQPFGVVTQTQSNITSIITKSHISDSPHEEVATAVAPGKRALSDVEEDDFMLVQHKKKPTPDLSTRTAPINNSQTYAKTAAKNVPRAKPQPEGPQGDLELRVYRTHHTKTTISQQQWLAIQLQITNILVTNLQSAESDEIPMLLCLHSKWCLTESCGILKLGSTVNRDLHEDSRIMDMHGLVQLPRQEPIKCNM